VVCNEAGCGMNIAGACRRTGVGAGFTSLAEIIAEGLGLMQRQEHGS
jgi:L-lactate dehydrogenase complex protein LldE